MELTQCINYLLTTAQHKVFQEMSSRLEKFDVTPVQYGVMYCLWIEGKTKPKEIAAELKLENSTISGVLERMEKKELIERQVSKEGKALQNPILATVEEVNKDVLSEMSQEEQSELKKALRILGGLEDE